MSCGVQKAKMSHIAKWGNLVGIADAADYGDLVGLFQFFRPDGDGVEAVFDGYAFGQEILSRVRRCYDATRAVSGLGRVLHCEACSAVLGGAGMRPDRTAFAGDEGGRRVSRGSGAGPGVVGGFAAAGAFSLGADGAGVR